MNIIDKRTFESEEELGALDAGTVFEFCEDDESNPMLLIKSSGSENEILVFDLVDDDLLTFTLSMFERRVRILDVEITVRDI